MNQTLPTRADHLPIAESIEDLEVFGLKDGMVHRLREGGFQSYVDDETARRVEAGVAPFLDLIAGKVSPDDLAEVAKSGSYGDLQDKPVLGSAAAADTTDFATAEQGANAIIRELDAKTDAVTYDTLTALGEDGSDNEKAALKRLFEAGGTMAFVSPTAAAAANIPAAVKTVQTQFYEPNYAVPASLTGGAKYRRVNQEPVHGLKFRSSDRWTAEGNSDSDNGGWWEIDEPQVDVAMAGAKSINNFDNGPAFQRAVDYVMSKTYGGTVLIPEGKYDVITQVIVPKSYRIARLLGVGQGATIVCHKVTTTANGGAAIYIGDTGSPATDGLATVENLQFVGNGANGVALYFDHANGASVERCLFQDLKEAIQLNHTYAFRLRHNKGRGVQGTFVRSLTACHNLVATGNQFLNCGLNDSLSGRGIFRIEAQSLNCVFRDNDFENCHSVWNVVAGNWKTWIIEGNYIEYISGYVIVTSGVCTFKGLKFNYNQVNDCSDWAFPKTIGGEFIGNTVNEMTVNMLLNGCEDIDIGATAYGTNVFISAPPFKDPALSNGYAAVGTRTLGYRKAVDGLVTLRGYANSGTPNQIIFTLPATHRPERNMTYLTPKADGTAIMVTVNSSNGNVTCNSTDVCLDGIHFVAQVSNIG